MTYKTQIVILSALLVFSCNRNSSNGNSTSTTSESQRSAGEKEEDRMNSDSKNQNDDGSEQDNKKGDDIDNKKDEGPKWNYSGFVGKTKIKANIVYGEATHHPHSGAIQIPISGYYFYESVKVPMSIEGSCNGMGVISFVATTEGGDEYFEGNFTNGQLGDFSGTWSKGSKSLSFVLNSNE